MIYTKTLLDDFIEAGLTQLIPRDYNIHTGEYIGFSDENYTESKPYIEDEYEPDIWEIEENRLKEEDDEDIYEDYYNRPENLDELKCLLNYEFYSDEDFLNLSAADIFGITKSQLKFINIDLLLTGSLINFIDIMKDSNVIKEIPDVQQRIKWATIKSISFDINSVYLPTSNFGESEINKYAEELGMEFPKFTSEDRKNLHSYLVKLVINNEAETAISLIKLLSDYYRMYCFGMLANRERELANEPKVIYEIYPKWSRIKEMHDKSMRDSRLIRNKFLAKYKDEINEKILETTKTAEYKKFLHEDDNFSIIAVKDYDDLVREGNCLDHCVADYAKDLGDGKSLIYFLRENYSKNTPYFTIEVGQNEEDSYDKHYYLKQCYTYKDTIDKSKECLNFILSWSKLKKLRIKCEL